ncbi:helix-turn-helix transcriptional regulator [Tengunoibacter tsumagoiensis]|uniref:Transcriptional regulator n=1 Tax=Tengunoibacter tsumagoiensis TaxID=2014871 RepID=A0A402A4E0_9CHLR|nr:YafY family protein [Tengunoibacter tsumagoiensis]GCE13865.1 transcriptional regulator [Tengunoibacter tsumagoiensis]
MHFPTTRVLTVLELLQARSRISGPELASRLEVDTRTVRRYITMLQDLGIPVEAERGRYGSYRLRPGFKLPPLMFTDDEALGVTIGLLVARKLGLLVAGPAVEGALAKIERVLPVAIRAQVQALQESLILDLPSDKTVPEQRVVRILVLAIQQRQRVLLRYQAYKATESERKLDAYGLVYRIGFWYLVGYCHLRQEMRTFRLDRILDVTALEEGFQRPAEFDCLAFVLHSISQTPNIWSVEVLLKLSLAEAQRIVPPALATLEEVHEGVLLRCAVEDLDWIALLLVNLRCDLKILRPVELYDAMRNLATRVSSLAE